MKSVVICGSCRFKKEIKKFIQKLKALRVVVYEPVFEYDEKKWAKFSDKDKDFIALGLTYDHFYKIQMADVVFVFNKDGYAGFSTTLEIGFAVAAGKPIYALSKDDEICRQMLFRGIVPSPERLVRLLR